MGVPAFAAIGFLMGDSGRVDKGLVIFWRERAANSGGGFSIDGNPIEESEPGSRPLGDCNEAPRFRFFDIADPGDLSLKRSSKVLVRGLV